MSALAGRVAVVTGAGRGIGAATAIALAAAGAKVVLAGRDRVALDAVATQLEPGSAVVVPTDVGDATAVAALVERAIETFGRLDIAVHNAAGGGHRPTPLADVSVEDFDSAIAVNLRGIFLGMKYAIPAMLAGGGGAIVNLGSTAGLQGVSGLAAYCASKHGLVGLTRVAALDYAAHGVRVNLVAPGPVATERHAQLDEPTRQLIARSVPMGRVAAVDEVADAVVWLCSDASSYLTGAVIALDGGKLAGTAPYLR